MTRGPRLRVLPDLTRAPAGAGAAVVLLMALATACPGQEAAPTRTISIGSPPASAAAMASADRVPARVDPFGMAPRQGLEARDDPGRVGIPATLPSDEVAVAATLSLLGPAFRRTETEHFVVLSDCPVAWTRTRESLLERARHQFLRAAQRLELHPREPRTKLLCVLIDDHEHFRRFAREHDGLDAGWVAGYYAAAPNRVVFYNEAASPAYASVWEELEGYEGQADAARRRARDARGQGQAELAQRLDRAAEDLVARVNSERRRLTTQATDFSTAKTIHEAVHLLAFNTGVQRPDVDYPFWVTEGLASSFETDDPERAFGPDRDGPEARRARFRELLEAGGAPAVSDLVCLTRLATLDAEAADAIYASGATLFAHLARRERVALALYLRALAAEGPRRLGPERHLQLFVRYFGDPRSVERRMLADLR